MPIDLMREIIQALAALAPQIPSVMMLTKAAVSILETGSVTPAEEAAIRDQLDQVKRLIDDSA